MYVFFKNAVRAHMERTAQKSVQNIVYTMNPVTTLMEPVLMVVKMDTQDIIVLPVRTSVNVIVYQFLFFTLYLFTETLIYIIFQLANTDVTAKTVHIRVPLIARHANILTVHAVAMQVGVDQIVVLVFMFFFLV